MFLFVFERYDFSEIFVPSAWLAHGSSDLLHEHLSDLCQIKTGVNFIELEFLFPEKSWTKPNLPSYHGRNKT